MTRMLDTRARTWYAHTRRGFRRYFLQKYTRVLYAFVPCTQWVA